MQEQEQDQLEVAMVFARGTDSGPAKAGDRSPDWKYLMEFPDPHQSLLSLSSRPRLFCHTHRLRRGCLQAEMSPNDSQCKAATVESHGALSGCLKVLD